MQKLPCTLLVDDDSTTNYLNSKLLERLRVTEELLVAQNGQQALDLMQQRCQADSPGCPVLIFLDVNMPVMNGIEFLEAYQGLALDQHQASIIIVMLTTSLHPQDVQRIEAYRIAGFLSKPLTRDKINSVLEQHFDRQLPAEA